MSVCDEGWGGRDEWGELIFCPCSLTYGGSGLRVCGYILGIWLERWETKPNEPPDSCPHAPALKAVVENPELALFAVGTCKNCGYEMHTWIGDTRVSCRAFEIPCVRWQPRPEIDGNMTEEPHV